MPTSTQEQATARLNTSYLTMVVDGDPIKCTAISDLFQTEYGTPPARVAVKRYRYGAISKAGMIKQNDLLAETITNLRNVKHRSLLSYLGVSEMDGSVCIVTPWIEQGNIRDYISRTATANRRDLLTQVAAGLEFLHTARPQVVHGNIHPENVLIAEDGRALLADFGLNAVAPDTSALSITLPSMMPPRGRILYKAPELLDDNEDNSAAADVFAFGVLMWELYAGRPPFAQRSNVEARQAFLQGQRPAREEMPRGEDEFTPALWRLMSDCWAQDAAARPSMTEVRRRLDPRYARGGFPSVWNTMVQAVYALWSFVVRGWT